MATKPKSLTSEDATEHEWLLSLNPSSISEAATMTYAFAKLASNGRLDNARESGHSDSGCSENSVILGSTDQWACDDNGDLDWSYSQACEEQLSGHQVLLYLFEHAFSIPTREYPSMPLVHVRLLKSNGLEEGEVVKLPHPYRLPLMFIGKYIWEFILSALGQSSRGSTSTSSSTSSPSFDLSQILHLARLTQYLFIRAKLKERKSGMERGWHCVAFDRFLTRLHKHWLLNDPKSSAAFVKTYGCQEYSRDMFKHDWRRWTRRGFNAFKVIKLNDDEVENGLSFNQYRSPLRFMPKSEEWILQGQFITSKISTLLSGVKTKPSQSVAVKQQEEEDNDILKDAFNDLEWSSISELTESDEDNIVATPSSPVNKSHTIQISPASGTTSLKIKLTPAKRRHEPATSHLGSAATINDARSTPGRSSKRLRVKAEAKADPPLSDIPNLGPAMQPSSSFSSATPASVIGPGHTILVKPRPKPRPKGKISSTAATMSRTLAAMTKNPQLLPTTPTSKRKKLDEWDNMVVNDPIDTTSIPNPANIPNSTPPNTETPSPSPAAPGPIQIPTIPSIPQSPLPDLAAAVRAMSALVKPFRQTSPISSGPALEPAVTNIATTQVSSSLAKISVTEPLTTSTTLSFTLLDKEVSTSTPVDGILQSSKDTSMHEAVSTTIELPPPVSLPSTNATPVSQSANNQETATTQDGDQKMKSNTVSTGEPLEPTSSTESTHAFSSNPTITSTSTNKRGRARLINPTIPIISTSELEARKKQSRPRGRPRKKVPDPIPSPEEQTMVPQPFSQASTPRPSNVSVVIQRKGSASIRAATATASISVQTCVPDGKETPTMAVMKEKDGKETLVTDQMGEKESSGQIDEAVGKVLPETLVGREEEEEETTTHNTRDITPNVDTQALNVMEDQNSILKPKQSAKAKGKRPARSRSSSVEIIGMSTNSPSVAPSTSVPKRRRPRATSNPGGKTCGDEKDDNDDEIEELVEHPARKKRKFGPPQKKDELGLITQKALALLVQLVEKQEVLPVGRANTLVAEVGEERLSGWQFRIPEATMRSRASIAPLERDVDSVSQQLKQLSQRVADVEKGLEKDRSVRSTEPLDAARNDPISSPIPEDKSEDVNLAKEPQSQQDGKSAPPHVSLDLDNPEMRASLAIVVDNLVSTKLLALNQTVNLLKPSKPSHSGSESPTRLDSPSTSLGPSASVASISNDTLAGSSTDSAMVNTLMDEIKALREEFLAKEQKEKEELHSMRQLHSAEVDALRRRLAYLESRAPPPFDIYDRTRRYPPPLPYDGYGPVSVPTRGEKHHYYDRHSEHYHESSYRHHERHVPELERASASASRPFSPPPIRGSNGSRRSKQGDVLEEEAPLPIKSQRKQHIISLSRGPAS